MTLIELALSPYIFVKIICLEFMNMFVRLDEIPAMTLKDIKGKNDTDGRTHGQMDNMTTVYPPQTKFAGGIRIQSDVPFEWVNRCYTSNKMITN